MTDRSSPLARAGSAIATQLSRHPDRYALGLLLLAGLLLRLVFAFRTPTFATHDSVSYFQAGYELARGYGFELTFKRTPLYPLFVAGVVALVSEDLQALSFVQHILGLVTITLTYVLGRSLFGRIAGFAAGLCVALSSSLVIYEHYIMAEAIFMPLLLAFALALVRGVRVGSIGWLLLAGFVLGLAGLARPVGQAIAIAVPNVLLAASRSWRRAALGTMSVAIGLAAIVLPWMGRNAVFKGSFDSSGLLGQTLVGRITRHDEGFVVPSPDSPSPNADSARPEARALILRQMAREARPSAINHRLRQTFGLTEAQASNAMKDVSLEVLSAQPDYYLRSTLVKWRRLLWGEHEDFLGNHWGNRKSSELAEDWTANATIAHLFSPPIAVQEAAKPFVRSLVSTFSPSSYSWPLFALLLIGLIVGLRQRTRWITVFIVLVVVSLTLPAAALVGYVPRYRYPADPFLALLIGAGVTGLVHVARSIPGAFRQGLMTKPSRHRQAERGERPAREPAT